jgi:outer membrane protein assembly factor BamB
MAADETNVYTVGETKVDAYRLESGEQSWEQITASEIRTTSAVGGSNLYFITGDGQLHVLDTATGERLGRYQVNNMRSSLTIVGNRLYCNRTDQPSSNNEVGQMNVIGSSEGE